MLAIVFPNLNPIALELSIYDYSIAIYWYGIAYVVGIFLAQFVAKKIENKYRLAGLSNNDFDKLIVYLIFGIILGGRIGYVTFYMPYLFITDFFEVFNIRGGGLSFHGGLIGVAFAILLFCMQTKKEFWRVNDLIACVAPIGIFCGRIANFVNAELVGRKTNVAWGVIFPYYDSPRHPSQLYEAFAEGLLLFILLQLALQLGFGKYKKGQFTGLFLILYGLFRFILEFYRQPDNHVGFFFSYFSMGQLLSVPMLFLGIFLMIFIREEEPHRVKN